MGRGRAAVSHRCRSGRSKRRSRALGGPPGRVVVGLESEARRIALFNPVVYLVSGFRWSFFGVADVGVGWSLGITLGFLLLCLGVVAWIFKTGYRLKA